MQNQILHVFQTWFEIIRLKDTQEVVANAKCGISVISPETCFPNDCGIFNFFFLLQKVKKKLILNQNKSIWMKKGPRISGILSFRRFFDSCRQMNILIFDFYVHNVSQLVKMAYNVRMFLIFIACGMLIANIALMSLNLNCKHQFKRKY